ncbi:30S ribosomal protein S20 [Geovibrio thiophilus]|uniref:Small ribosomal subunit protein bS20 n=1 Tax=Geovibrio thiophilus TaxID=139438 RepID=A0A3R5UYI3_9BACT|nr:30S ribosomal protein S20 [Geovibrio thiophilus]QAR33617.1 30S ribosomal protein S20 [Geovibrio thiophilus]
MAHTLCANKRIRQDSKKALANKANKSKMRTVIKKFLAAVSSGDKAVAAEAFKNAEVTIRKISTKGVIHKNQASRRVSRLAVRLNAMG